MGFTPDGDGIAGGGLVWTNQNVDVSPGRVFLWSIAGPEKLLDTYETPAGKPVWNMTVTPDGSLIVAAGFDDGAIYRWDTRTGAVEWTSHSVDGGVTGSDVSNDGRSLVTGAQGSTVLHLSDARSGTPLGKPLTGLAQSPDTVDMSPDGSTVVAADNVGTVLLWDVMSGTVIGGPFPGPSSQEALAASFTPDGRRVVMVSDRGSGWVWDVDPPDWKARACEIAGRSLTLQEWQQVLPDRPYHATCGS